jgi:tRNA(fMet)-specific endonuclease VapC
VRYVLDTSTVSFLMRGEPTVARRLEPCARADVLLPQPVVAEIEYGLSRLPPSARRRRLRARFEILLSELARASWTDPVSRAFGETRTGLETRGVRLEDFDVAVAAHALAWKATLVTDDVSRMGRIAGLKLQNWREPQG